MDADGDDERGEVAGPVAARTQRRDARRRRVEGERGQAARILLWLMEQDQAIRLLMVG